MEIAAESCCRSREINQVSLRVEQYMPPGVDLIEVEETANGVVVNVTPWRMILANMPKVTAAARREKVLRASLGARLKAT